MKSLPHAIFALLIPISSVFSQDVFVSKPVLMGNVPAKVKKYDSTTKTWVEADGYGYAFMFYLKNVSEQPITVVTNGLSRQTSPTTPKQEVKLSMDKMTVDNGKALVIPSREELKLVDLRPGEAALMKTEFKMSVPLEEIYVIYQPEDFYDGRFGYWTGKSSSEPLIIDAKK